MMYLSETKLDRKMKRQIFLMLLITLIWLTTSVSFAAPPADSIKVIAKHAEADANSIYQVSFVASKPIPPKAVIRITFPPEFDLSELMIAGSTTINGGFEIKVEKQILTMKRSGLGREIPANEPVDVKFAIVKNPKRSGDDYKIVVEMVDEGEKIIIKKDELHKILPQKE